VTFAPTVIEALRPRKGRRPKTGCITNNMPHNAAGGAKDGGTSAGRSLYSRDIMQMFDVIIESAKSASAKPNPKIYEMMSRTARVTPPVAFPRRSGACKPQTRQGRWA